MGMFEKAVWRALEETTEENEKLRRAVMRHRKMYAYRREFDLTAQQAKILSILSYGTYVETTDLAHLLRSTPASVRSQICNLRNKVEPSGIIIETHGKLGIIVLPECLEKLKAIVDACPQMELTL
jgi:hypothetical protein